MAELSKNSAWTEMPPVTDRNRVTHGMLVDLAEGYFAALDNADVEGVLAYYNDDAIFTIQSAHSSHRGRDTGIRAMYEEFIASYAKIRHIHFRHVVDVENQRIASQFRAEMTDLHGNEVVLTSANFFYVSGGKFSRVYVYMSDGINVLK
ncbi:nuclear transport factor 2 family protein [Streptomyces shenzhenensis]|uniref:nuclear transport factor 2 family protein n=1 Tax=Streptomyces shenzhenensis TaxID=943815 RepID=UPI003812C123